MIYECVINVSVAEDTKILDRLVQAAGMPCIDVHTDIDHNRSVITLASIDLPTLSNSAFTLIKSCMELRGFDKHMGVHPRLGIVDVVPFVSYDEKSIVPTQETISAAHSLAEKVHRIFSIPIFFYDYACESNTTLPHIRKNAFKEKNPNIGDIADVETGSICIGAREPLVAININCHTNDLGLAKLIATEIRESSGGYKGVRAIGLDLESQNKVQVSMNIVDTKNVDLEKVINHIIDRLSDQGIDSAVELVGLMPRYVFDRLSDNFVKKHELSTKDTVEYRLSSSWHE